MTTLRLTEYQDWSGPLCDADVAAIAHGLGKRFTIQRRALGDAYVLNPQQFVGVVRLPSGLLIEARPKVPLRTVFAMLALCHVPADIWREERADFASFAELFEYVVAHFLELVTARLARGLFRAYEERQANLPAIRGRIDFTEDLRRNLCARQRVACRFTELTGDIPENQIIRQTVHAMSGWEFSPRLRQRLRLVDATMGEIARTAYPASACDAFTYHRHNDDYRPIHQLCRLLLAGQSLRETAGDVPLQAFLVDMNRLFEDFVTAVVARHAPAGWVVTPQYRTHLDHEALVDIRPDLMFTWHGTPRFVADCKYKVDTMSKADGMRKVAAFTARPSDLFQLTAYCAALGVAGGALISPQANVPRETRLTVGHPPTRLHGITLNLNLAGADLAAECQRFAARLFDLAALERDVAAIRSA